MENRKNRVVGQKRYFVPHNQPNKEDFVFGFQSVLETLRSGKPIDKLIIQKDLKGFEELERLARKHQAPIQKAPLEKLNRVTRKNHQGVIAFVAQAHFAKLSNIVVSTFEHGQAPLILILDRVTDVRNFGAICRSAECAGVHTVVLPFRGGAAINGDAMKTSSGALNFIPICREPNLLDTVRYLQNSGIQVVASTEKANTPLYKIDFSIPTAIIMGSEEDGVSEELLSIVDNSFRIPLLGKIESLNVAAAAAVVLYESVRQRV